MLILFSFLFFSFYFLSSSSFFSSSFPLFFLVIFFFFFSFFPVDYVYICNQNVSLSEGEPSKEICCNLTNPPSGGVAFDFSVIVSSTDGTAKGELIMIIFYIHWFGRSWMSCIVYQYVDFYFINPWYMWSEGYSSCPVYLCVRLSICHPY